MRGNLWDDPRVSRLVDMTDSSEAAIVGALYWIWATADQHTEDGVMHGLTLRGIDRKTGVAGFGAALVAIGWLADNGDSVTILHFEEHNGASAKSRIQTAKRVANHKANAKVTEPALPEQHQPVTGALPREEKRREDSEAKASGGKPPMTPDEIIFGYGVPLLTNAGSTDKHARSFLGGLRKAHGDDSVVNTLRECIRAKPLQPMEWLAAAMLPDAAGATETRHQKAQREKMMRDFPNLFPQTNGVNHGAAALLG
jgi:hypothetical protein